MITILFPGRHHMLTKFQQQYLQNLVQDGIDGKKIGRIIFAITSANHANTRRNPIPLYLRAMAITKFAQTLPCAVKIYPIPDIRQTDKFAQYILSQIFYQSGDKLTPKNSVLACSTPPIIKMFKKLGFNNLPVELINEKKGAYASLRPYEIVALLVKAGKKWRHDERWKEYATEGIQDVYLQYSLGTLMIELFNDSLISDDADVTETRDYNTYAAGMDQNIRFKFNDIQPFVIQGKIVDAGCGTGSLIKILAKEFGESDIIGIEATRKFYEFCKTQDYGDSFVFFYRRNILDQNFKENTANTFIYSSILHEVYSYIGKRALTKLLRHTHKQLTHGGRIIIRDVVGPENPMGKVFLKLNETDGQKAGDIHELSSYSKFLKFAEDFKPRKIKFETISFDGKKLIKLSMQDAYEYISKMNYTDNWQSEMHEEFGFYSFAKWKDELKKAGFKIVPGSKEFKNEYIIENMYKNKATLYKFEGKSLVPVAYPPTNMILVGEKK